MSPQSLWDEPLEYQVWFAICMAPECGWEDEENHGSVEDCQHTCPLCGAETEIHQDWDNR